MKVFRKVMLAVLCAIVLTVAYVDVVRAWDSPATISSQGMPADSPSIARDDNFVFVVWVQQDPLNPPDTDVWIRVNTAGGDSAAWQPARVLWDTNTQWTSTKEPDVAVWQAMISVQVIQGPVYVAWAEQTGASGGVPTFDIYAIRIDSWNLATNQFAWTGPIVLDATPDSRAPRVAADSQYAQIVWVSDTGIGNARYELYHTRWDGVTAITQKLTTGYSWEDGLVGPDVAVSSNPDTTVNVVWECMPPGATSWEVYSVRSTNRGQTWPPPGTCANPISGGPGTNSFLPSIADFLTYVHVSWTDFREGQGVIYYLRSTTGGASWGTEQRISSAVDPKPVGRSAIASCGLCVGIVWNERRPTDDLVFKYSLSSGDSWLPAFGVETITSGLDEDRQPAIASDRLTNPENDPFLASYHVAYQRTPTVGPPRVEYYRRFSAETSSFFTAGDPSRWGSSAALDTRDNQFAYVFGGWNGPLSPDCTILKFDTINRMPIPWTGDTLVAPNCAETSSVWVPNLGDTNSAVIFGGRSATSVSNKIYRFYPGQPPGQGRQVVFQYNFPDDLPRFGTSAAFDSNGDTYAYVFGGRTGIAPQGNYLSTIVRWSKLGGPDPCAVTLPSPRAHTSAVWSPAAGRAYVIGGRGDGGDIDEVLEFDPGTCDASGTLPVVGHLPSSVEGLGVAPRYGGSAVWDATAHIPYLFGGECCGGAYRFDTIVRVPIGYDFVGAGPTTCLVLPTARSYTSAVLNPNSRDAFVFYGSFSTLSETTTVLYHPE